MNGLFFDALTRRASLMSLGAAGVAGLAGSITARARNKNKKGNSGKKCKKQVGKCREGLADLCAVVVGAEDVEECLALFGPCCEPLKGCNTALAFACAVEVLEELEK